MLGTMIICRNSRLNLKEGTWKPMPLHDASKLAPQFTMSMETLSCAIKTQVPKAKCHFNGPLGIHEPSWIRA